VPTTTTTTAPATSGLQNHWAFDGSYIDRVGGMNMIVQPNVALTTDRFGNLNSAVLFSSSYGTVPPGIYFDPATGGFTIMTWQKISVYGDYPSIIDFGNGALSDNIMFYFVGTTGTNRLYVLNVGSGPYGDFSSPVNIGVWTHVAVSVSGSLATFYRNGTASGTMSGIVFIF